MKNVQITKSLLVKMYALTGLLEINYDLEPEHAELVQEIQKEIGEKVERMERHKLYTTSKTATSEEEKEKARQAYLDSVGMHKDFRC